MNEARRSVADLKPGEYGVINELKDTEISLKLLEMGLLPGTEILLKFTAPLGDPVCIHVEGYNLSLRLDEAAVILLK